MTNKKIVGQLKEEMLSVIGNHLSDDKLEKLTTELMEKDIISGKGLTNGLVFQDGNGNDYYPVLSWKPRVKGTKLGDKSPEMLDFQTNYYELKTNYKV